MSTPTHLLFGYTIATICTRTGMDPHTYRYLYPVAMLAANGPDFDMLVVRLKGNHRFSKFHFPLFWAIGLGLTDLILRVTGMTQLLPYLLVISFSVLSHFILDTFDAHTGILWLAPVSKKAYCFLRKSTMYPTTVKEHVRSYIRHPVMIAEGLVWILCLVILTR